MAVCPTSLPKQYDIYPFISPDRFIGKLKGSVVLITGASSGVGRATALAFASAGAHVACVARRRELLDTLVQDIESKYSTEGVRALAIATDVSLPSAPKEIVEQTESTLGPIDVLVNNAASQRIGRFQDFSTFEEWWQLMDLNLRSPLALTHAVIPSMIARKTGTLINIVSTSGVHNNPWQTAYSVSKCALTKMSQNINWELEPYGIRAFSVHPGNVKTGMVDSAMSEAGAVFQKHAEGMTEKVQKCFEPYQELKFQVPEVCAQTCVALTCERERTKGLSGRYVDCEQPLDKVLEAVESGRVESENLYWLKLEQV